MRTFRFLLPVTLTAIALSAVLVAPAQAATGPLVGIADQKLDTFTNKLYRGLKLRHTRALVPWDAALKKSASVDKLLSTIRAAHVEPLVHLNKNCDGRNCKLPSVAEYMKGFQALRKRYPWVKEYGIWNEGNHGDQPTHTTQGAKRTAEYFNAAQRACPKCTLVAADVLDQGNLAGWTKAFLKTARNPKIWGLHNYRDVNTGRPTGTRQLFELLQGSALTVKPEIWLTETGGIYFFKTGKGKIQYKRSQTRQARATKYMFQLARDPEFEGLIKRLYVYHWRSDGVDDDQVRFDAGLLNADGTPRKAFAVVRDRLRSHQFKH
jgi:hypothetical protein